MKIYTRMVFDKDNNLIESESHEYQGSVSWAMPNPPPAPNPVPVPVPTPVNVPVSTQIRSSGRPLQAGQRGRGVLIQAGTALGAQPQPGSIESKNLLQPEQQIAQNILRLIGGGY